jgi:hypothetical protein
VVNNLDSTPITTSLYVKPARACPQSGNALGFFVVFQLEEWFRGKVVLYLIIEAEFAINKRSSVPNLFKPFLKSILNK